MLYEGRDPHIILKMGDDPHKMEHLETVADWAGGTSRNILEKVQSGSIYCLWGQFASVQLTDICV